MTPSAALVPVTSVIFTITYIGLAIGKIPPLRVDRAGIAVIGMSAMLVAGLTDLKGAAAAIDYDTLALLFGMMVLVACLRIAGFFQLMAELIDRAQPGPFTLLALTMGLSGVLSAFLVNDIVCVSLTPLILDICRRAKRNPIPFLIGLATASNVGSTATITGNPQNIIIGSLSGISYLRFAERLAPIAIIGLLINFAIVAIVYRKMMGEQVESGNENAIAEEQQRDNGQLVKCAIVTIGVLILFFAGQPIAVVALGAAAVMLASRIEPEKIYRLIDWPLLVMFIGLFVVVQVFNEHIVSKVPPETWQAITAYPVSGVSALSLVLSNLVSNVPAVLLFKPIIDTMPDAEQAWLALAMSSTLAGNLTVLGSVANLIVVENARRAGIDVGFLEYLKVGVPVTLITTLVGIGWLSLMAY